MFEDKPLEDLPVGRSRLLVRIIGAIVGLAFLSVIVLFLLGPWIWSEDLEPTVDLTPPTDPQAAKAWNAVQLVGVIPDGGDDLLDVNGKRIGTTFGSGAWDRISRSMVRTLVFDIPQDQDIEWSASPEICVSQTGRSMGTSHSDSTADIQGKRRRVFELFIDRTYPQRGWFRSHPVPIDRIDVTVRYHLPTRAEAACTFRGPFEVGQAVQCEEGHNCTVTPQRHTANHGEIQLHLSATKVPIPMESAERIFAYDAQGMRYLREVREDRGVSRTVSGNWTSIKLSFVVPDLPLERIATITLGEKPQEKTFRNILVRYPDRPIRDHPEYLDKMADALGLSELPPRSLRHQIRSAQDALKVVDIVRGPHIEDVWRAIATEDLAGLSKEQQEKLRRVAQVWTDHGNHNGILLGLAGNWPEFGDPALDRLERGARYHFEIARELQRYRGLSAKQLARAADLLRELDEPHTRWALLRCLANNQGQPGGRDILLRLAESEETWLWWPAIGLLEFPNPEERTGLRAGLRPRFFARRGPDRAGDPALAAKARELLATLPTAKLAIMAPPTLGEVVAGITRNLPPADAQTALLNLLQDLVDQWAEGRSYDAWRAIDRTVRHLNHLSDLDLGGIGADLHKGTENLEDIDWLALAKQTLMHFGRGPSTRPARREVEKDEDSL
jgi:hypothetical protein